MKRPSSLCLVLVAVLLLAAPCTQPTAAGDPGTEKQRVDAKLGELRGRIETAREREGVLTSEISAVSGQIRLLQADVDGAQARLTQLEAELAAQRRQLGALGRRIRELTAQLGRLRQEYAAALTLLERRVREIYVEGTPDAIAFILDARSFSDLLDHAEYMNAVGLQDERIASRVAHAAMETARLRSETQQARRSVVLGERTVAARTAEQRAVRDRLLASRDRLAAARGEKEEVLASVRVDRAAYLDEAEALEAQSAALAAQIRAAQAAAAAQASGSAQSSPGGLAWPVSGPVTSGFGIRWGRMHEGIDIAVPVGTPVRAAAAGTVIYAGWLGGYGNLVVIDHGGGLSTAYAHNTSLAVALGQSVAAGEVIAYSGSTGHSTGPHVHFEVRLNGSPTDPLGYL